MIYNRCFLRTVFVVSTFVLYCSADALAWTVQSQQYNNNNYTNVSAQNPNYNAQNRSNIVSICPAGQYISKCGNYRVGFNWLKSATLPYQGENVETNNYYVGDTNLELFAQMRLFFGGDGTTQISYKDVSDNILTTGDYVRERELILNNLCHPLNSSVTCTTCPNNANVAESVVQIDSDNETVERSWEFHTIADCYMTNFEDSTGSYFYIEPNVDVNNNSPEAECYYTNTSTSATSSLNGDAIGTFVPGLSDYRTFDNILQGTVITLTPAFY